jgi:hypothetical protein
MKMSDLIELVVDRRWGELTGRLGQALQVTGPLGRKGSLYSATADKGGYGFLEQSGSNPRDTGYPTADTVNIPLGI